MIKIKTILYCKTISFRCIVIPDFKLFYKAVVIKKGWYWPNNRRFDEWKGIEDPDLNPHAYGYIIFDKEAKNIKWQKKHLQQMVPV